MARNADPADLMTVAGRRPGYVEGVVFDPVAAEDVTIGMAIDTPEDMAGAGMVFAGHENALAGAKVYCGEDLPNAVSDWLAAHTAPTSEANADPQARSRIWELLNLTPEASHAEASQALMRQTVLTYRDLVQSGVALPQLASFSNAVQWDGYIKSLRAASNNVFGPNKEALDRLIALQEARVFFANRA